MNHPAVHEKNYVSHNSIKYVYIKKKNKRNKSLAYLQIQFIKCEKHKSHEFTVSHC